MIKDQRKFMELIRTYGIYNHTLGKIEERIDDCFDNEGNILIQQDFDDLDDQKQECKERIRIASDDIVQHLIER